jgi:sirohydrochlorin ferrochelatase
VIGQELKERMMTDPHRPAALILSHGQPSAPEGPQADMAALAAAVAPHLPGWPVRGATLAAPGGLEAALDGLGDGAVWVYPFFMADGWFVRSQIPKRLAAAGRRDCVVLPPFGLDPAVTALCVRRAREGAEAHGLDPAASVLVLAAHGSPSNARPAEAARAVAAAIAASGAFREVRTGFVDEAPYLKDAARGAAPGACLPFFAAENGHVREDLPEALAEAGFEGPLLPAIGSDAETPAIIAAAFLRAARETVAG